MSDVVVDRSRTCERESCGKTYTKPPRETWKKFAGRRYCSQGCARDSMIETRDNRAKLNREYVIGEVEFLIGTDSTEGLARRLGYKDGWNLINMMRDWGRLDLVERLLVTRYDRGDVDEVAA